MVRRFRRMRVFAGLSVLVACGARTQLGAPLHNDASTDSGPDVHDASLDVADVIEEDVLPPIDAFHDGPIPFDCVDAGLTLVYLLTTQNELYSFYPPTLDFKKIGDIACPNANNASPYSMAVDRKGIAYSVFNDGRVFQISTANAACQATSYVPSQAGQDFFTFGMGFAGDQFGESLYVADAKFNQNSAGLATLGTKTFTRSFIADFQPELPRCELTGTGDGRLFAFCLPTSGNGSQLAEVDRTNAKIVAVNQLNTGSSNDAFAYAFWGGLFWIFTSPGGASMVTRYDPATLAEINVSQLGSTIVGAGVSTCAPQ